MTKILLFSLCLFAATAASTDEYLVSESGIWGGTCPATVCTAPGDSWSFSFEVDSDPTPINVVSGTQFTSTITDFTYSIDGTPVSTITATDAIWYNQILEGGFIVVIPTGYISTLSAQLYQGPESSPLIQLGSYPLDSLVIDTYIPPPYNPLLITPVPEPSTYGLTVIGLGLLGLVRKRIVRAFR